MLNLDKIIILIYGGLFSISSFGLGLGTSSNPGPGFFPFMMGVVLMASSVWINIDRDSTQDLTALGSVLIAIAVFVLAQKLSGLVLASLLATWISCWHVPDTLVKKFLISAVITIGCCLLFVSVLGLPLRLW